MATTPFSNFLSILVPSRSKSSQFPPLPSQPPAQTPSPSSSSSASASLSFERKRQQHETVGLDGCSASSELTAVICPSLAYANTMYFNSAYNVQVLVEDNEPEERLLGRFRREVMRAGVIQEVRRRRYFENKQDELKRKSREAAKRNSRKRRLPFRAAGAPPSRQDASNKPAEKEEDDGDNWEMPEGEQGIPF